MDNEDLTALGSHGGNLTNTNEVFGWLSVCVYRYCSFSVDIYFYFIIFFLQLITPPAICGRGY